MIEKVIPDYNDDNPNPREYELLADGTWRMTMDIVDSWFSYSLDYKEGRVSEMLGFEKRDDGSYGVGVYEAGPMLVIPSEYKGIAVTAVIQPHYPEDCHLEAVEEIVLPDGIQRLGSECFSYCASLSRINIPESVTEIGRFAFADCEALKRLRIPSSVVSIGEYAFPEWVELIRE